jgi:hypothetical protein
MTVTMNDLTTPQPRQREISPSSNALCSLYPSNLMSVSLQSIDLRAYHLELLFHLLKFLWPCNLRYYLKIVEPSASTILL